jgi:hypothetical protein
VDARAARGIGVVVGAAGWDIDAVRGMSWGAGATHGAGGGTGVVRVMATVSEVPATEEG